MSSNTPTELACGTQMQVAPWPDPVIDAVGYSPQSCYVETYWLSTLGPSTTWLLRLIAAGFEDNPEGYELDCAATATRLGLGDRTGRHSPFVRSVGRLVLFDLAVPEDGRLFVRKTVPPLAARQVRRLPEALRASHAALMEEGQPDVPPLVVERARRLANALRAELRLRPDVVERELVRWHFHPAVAREVVALG